MSWRLVQGLGCSSLATLFIPWIKFLPPFYPSQSLGALALWAAGLSAWLSVWMRVRRVLWPHDVWQWPNKVCNMEAGRRLGWHSAAWHSLAEKPSVPHHVSTKWAERTRVLQCSYMHIQDLYWKHSFQKMYLRKAFFWLGSHWVCKVWGKWS